MSRGWLAAGFAILTPACYDLTLSPFAEEPVHTVGPRLGWAKIASGDGQETAHGTALRNGDFLVTGYFANQLLFGADEAHEATLDAGIDHSDGYLASFGPSGELDWARQLASGGFVAGYGLAALQDGGFVVVGLLRGAFTLDGVDGPQTLEARPNGMDDVFVAAFEPSGLLRWATVAGSSSADEVRAVATAPGPRGQVLVGGSFKADFWFGADESDPILTLPHALGNEPQGFVASYDEQGVLSWAAQTVGNAEVLALSTGADEILATGRFRGTTRFLSAAPGVAEQVLESAAGDDIFVAAYAIEDGSLLWAEALGGSGDDSACALQASANGDFVLAGTFVNAMDIGSTNLEGSGQDVFVASFDRKRDLRWARAAGSSESDSCAALGVASDGGVYLAGSILDEPITLGEAGSEVILAPRGSRDGFLARYDDAGKLSWARRLGGDAVGSLEATFDLLVPAAGSLIVVGTFEGRLSFGDDAAGETDLVATDNDLFFLRVQDD